MIDQALMIEIGELLNRVEIPIIPEKTNFWMLRSKGGFFYDEFVQKGYVGLGWNYIDKTTSLEENNIEHIKEGIHQWYGDKVPMTAINKCKKFIYDISEGDYAFIPNKGSNEVAICKLGEYYEEAYDVSKELLTIAKVENREAEVGTIKCPYKKRRKIEVLIRISANRLGPHLLKALSSYHGLSDMQSYAIDILNSVYDCYVYKNSIMFSVNVSKTKPIKAREMMRLMYGVTEMFCSIVDEDSITLAANLNSPGKVVAFLKDAYDKLGKNAGKILLIYVVLFGGTAFGFDFNGAIGSTIDIIKEIRTMSVDEEILKEELKGKQLDNYLKTLEVIQVGEEEGIDVDAAIKSIETMEDLNESLQFKSNEEFAKQPKEEQDE